MGLFDIFKSEKRERRVSSGKQHVSLSALTDPQQLSDFAKHGPNSRLRKAAVRRIPAKHKEILQDIIVEATDYKVKIAAVNRIKDQQVLANTYARCVDLDISQSVRSALVKQMTDTTKLGEISKTDSSKVVRNAAKKRLLSLGPRICSYTVKVDCPLCSNPIMLNGPMLSTTCAYCLSEVKIPKKFWGYVLRVKDSTTYSHLSGFRDVEIKSYLTPVRCSSCGAPLDVSGISTGSIHPITCSQCHAPNSTFPAPGWMKRMRKYSGNADQIFCADTADADTNKPHEESKPVLFACMQCGGSLKITHEMPRVMSCPYCGASQYLPDELWRALHPAKKKKEWFVRWSREEERAGSEPLS